MFKGAARRVEAIAGRGRGGDLRRTISSSGQSGVAGSNLQQIEYCARQWGMCREYQYAVYACAYACALCWGLSLGLCVGYVIAAERMNRQARRRSRPREPG